MGPVACRSHVARASPGHRWRPLPTPHAAEMGGSSLGLFCKGADPVVRTPLPEPHHLPRLAS